MTLTAAERPRLSQVLTRGWTLSWALFLSFSTERDGGSSGNTKSVARSAQMQCSGVTNYTSPVVILFSRVESGLHDCECGF